MLSVAWIIFWFSLPCARYTKDCIPVLSLWFEKYKWGLLLLFFLFSLSACILLFKKTREHQINNILRLLNTFIIVIYVLYAVRWVTYRVPNAQDNNQPSIIEIKNNHLPNIYHVLLDEYTNENALKRFGYNDSHFLQSLGM
jgi:H+/Cl- antiporter ClcA